MPKGPAAAAPANAPRIPTEKIAMRAYEKWCQRGYPHGNDQRDWYEAEQELLAEYRMPTSGNKR
jgi:hypothetical protein